jgi:hypothetical protein
MQLMCNTMQASPTPCPPLSTRRASCWKGGPSLDGPSPGGCPLDAQQCCCFHLHLQQTPCGQLTRLWPAESACRRPQSRANSSMATYRPTTAQVRHPDSSAHALLAVSITS